MPISGPSSYPPTIAQFVAHWNDVNTALGGGGPLVLPDGTTVAQLSAYRDELTGFATSIQDKINDVEINRATIDSSKELLVGRLGEFNRKVRGSLSKSPFAKALPNVPSINAGESNILAPLDDMLSLWGKINAATIPGFTGPLLLVDGYDLATFQTDLAALKTAYGQVQNFDQDLKLERESRNAVQETSYSALRDYRAAVLGTFAPTNALVVSLPMLTPAPGHTPDALTLNGEWQPSPGYAVLSWTASDDPDLNHYDIRMTPGPTYNTDSDTVIGTTQPGVLNLTTLAGLASPGDVASYKVYVILNTGNEAGSNAVTITRP